MKLVLLLIASVNVCVAQEPKRLGVFLAQSMGRGLRRMSAPRPLGALRVIDGVPVPSWTRSNGSTMRL